LWQIAGFDVDRNHFEGAAAELALRRVERKHLVAARNAVGVAGGLC
jgi:hypothetical protein